MAKHASGNAATNSSNDVANDAHARRSNVTGCGAVAHGSVASWWNVADGSASVGSSGAMARKPQWSTARCQRDLDQQSRRIFGPSRRAAEVDRRHTAHAVEFAERASGTRVAANAYTCVGASGFGSKGAERSVGGILRDISRTCQCNCWIDCDPCAATC